MSRDKTKGTDASSSEPAEPRARLTPIDVQQKEFRVSRFGGYKMRDVDEFLDQITDTLTALTTESERQRTVAAVPMTSSPDMSDVARQADEIIARARADAARIVAEAKATGAASGMSAGSPADRVAVNAFLARERQFLQSLAGLVQEHAEAVKGMARSTRPAPAKAKLEDAPAVAPVAERSSDEVRATGPRDDAPATPGTSGATSVQEPAGAPSAEVGASATEPDVGEQAPSSDATPAREPTRVPESEATVRLQEPASAAASRGEGDTEADRSLRDLFWGED